MGTGGIWEISVYFLQFFYELHAAFKKSFNLFKSYGYALSPRKSDLIEVSQAPMCFFFSFGSLKSVIEKPDLKTTSLRHFLKV